MSSVFNTLSNTQCVVTLLIGIVVLKTRVTILKVLYA